MTVDMLEKELKKGMLRGDYYLIEHTCLLVETYNKDALQKKLSLINIDLRLRDIEEALKIMEFKKQRADVFGFDLKKDFYEYELIDGKHKSILKECKYEVYLNVDNLLVFKFNKTNKPEEVKQHFS